MNIKILYLFVLLTLSSANAQYLPLGTDEMEHRLASRQDDLHDYRLDFKNTYDQSKINMSLGYSDRDHFSLFFLPRFRLSITSKLQFRYKLFVTSEGNYQQRIGSTFRRTGNYVGPEQPGDFKTLESYLVYNTSKFTLLAGRFSPGLTAKYPSDIMNSYLLPPVDGFYYRFKNSGIELEYGHYWLGYSSPGDEVEGYSRFYAVQKISFQNDWLTFGIGGKIIYAGEDMSVNWRYLNPLDPFVVSVFNPGQHYNDNHVLLGWFSLRNLRGLDISASVAVDEFQVDPEDLKLADNVFGAQLEVGRRINLGFINNLSISYLYASPYLGIHSGESTNYEVFGAPILSRYGPQSKRTELKTYFNLPLFHSTGWFSLYYMQEGDNGIIGTPYQTRVDDLVRESVTSHVGLEIEMMYKISESITIYAVVDQTASGEGFAGLCLYYSLLQRQQEH